MSTTRKTIEALTNRDYKYGFVTDIEADIIPAGLNEDVVRLISAKKNEPPFMLDWRLKAYRHWVQMDRSEGEPRWANIIRPSTTRRSSTTREQLLDRRVPGWRREISGRRHLQEKAR